MKKRLSSVKTLFFALIMVVSCFSMAGCTKDENTTLSYGQKPPGLIPEVFAPGIISLPEDMEFGCTFSPDAKEIYFTSRKGKTEMPVIMVSRQINGAWAKPEKMNIPGDGMTLEPHITVDGKTIYFGAERAKEGAKIATEGIWQMKRNDEAWGDLSYVTDGMYVSTTKDGSIYLTDIGRTRALVKIPYDGKQFLKRVKLVGGPNSPSYGIHPCISPDESFIIFDGDRPGGFGGEGDLYVSFNNGDGTWSEAFNLGKDINSEGIEFTASLSPDGKYIFFMKDYDLCWVDVKVIDQFRPAKN